MLWRAEKGRLPVLWAVYPQRDALLMDHVADKLYALVTDNANTKWFILLHTQGGSHVDIPTRFALGGLCAWTMGGDGGDAEETFTLRGHHAPLEARARPLAAW